MLQFAKFIHVLFVCLCVTLLVSCLNVTMFNCFILIRSNAIFSLLVLFSFTITGIVFSCYRWLWWNKVRRYIIWSWYTGRLMGRFGTCNEEWTGRSHSPPRPLLAVPNVISHISTANVPVTVLLYNDPFLCGFNVPFKWLNVSCANLAYACN